MTVKEIIEKVDSLRRNNQFTIGDKMKWLNQCEARLQLECLLMPCVEVQYDYTADADEELLAKTPYDELYVYYICAKIDEALSEMEKYNNTISQYNDVHESFQKWLIKTHDPKHNRIHIRREAPVIFRGDEVTVNLYGLPVDAEEVTEAKVLLTQNEVTTEIADVTMEGDTLTFTLTAAQSYALSKGSLFVGYDILSGEYRYREEQAKRFYVKPAPELQAIVDGEQGSPVDASLTIHGRAADAGVVGEIVRALGFESTEYPGCVYRMINGEVEWVNPPKIPNVEYRTTKRFAGKVVYQKLVQYTFESGIVEGFNYVPHGIENFATIVSESVHTNENLLPRITSAGSVSVYAVNEERISVLARGETIAEALTWFFDLEYTKR